MRSSNRVPDRATVGHPAAAMDHAARSIGMPGGAIEHSPWSVSQRDRITHIAHSPMATAQRHLLGALFGQATGPVTQRKTLTQAGGGLADGLTASADRRTTVGAEDDGGGLSGVVYDDAAVARQADKVSAIQAAAAAAGAVGARVDTWGRSGKVGKKPRKAWEPPHMFTRGQDNLGKAEVATLDPFFHRVAVPYGDAKAPQTLSLVYQHGSAFQGYVAQVTDTGSQAAPRGANMYHGKSNKARTANPYSDQHAKTENTNILGMTGGNNEEAIDAYTKLAGEGARWLCVRDNAATLANDSYFFCADPKDDSQVLTVRFDELWVSWASHFGKRYNIPDADVIAELRADRLGGVEPRADMGSRDVALRA